jgi:integrase
MPRPRPRYLHKDKSRHGKTVWYVRKGKRGKKYRLRAEYGSAEFDEQYKAAIDAIAEKAKAAPKPDAPGGSLQWGWLIYKAESADWKGLSRATRRQRENIMKGVLATGGAARIPTIDQNAIQAGVDRRMHTPFQAKNFLQTMRGLFKWLVANRTKYPGIGIKVDPTAGVSVKKPKTLGFLEWTYADILKYEGRWPIGTRQRVMLDVYCYTGLRRGDAAVVGKQHVSEQVSMIRDAFTGADVPVTRATISLATEKSQGRTIVHLPMLDVLKITLAAGPTGDLSFICTERGLPYKKESLGNTFKDACVEAGILDKSAHGLRKAAATRAADNGATTHELMAIFGWIDIKEAEIYTRAADRKRLAARAMSKLGT